MSARSIAKRTKKEMNMTEGPLFGKIVMFALPLMLSGILQLLYNAADTIVVGRFAENGQTALAAVGSTGALTNLIVNLFIGLSVGTSVAVSHALGARNDDDVHKLVHTSILTSLIGGVIVSFIGIALAKPLLQLMDTPDTVINFSVLYMRIIFCGMPAQMLYNYGAAILRAKGDTKRPLLILSLTGIVNVLLNLVLVIGCHLDVAGVAIATITSQYLSAALILWFLPRQTGALRFSFKELRFDREKFRRILAIGVPCGVQGSLFSISNVLIQSSINSFGEIAVAGNSAGANIEGFVYTAMNALYQASMTFTGQNVGAKKPKRILRVLRASLIVVCLVWCIVGGAALIFRVPLLSLYVDAKDPNFDEVVRYGAERIAIVGATYFLCGLQEVVLGSLRGMGKTIGPAIVSFLGACGLRIVWIYTVFQMWRSLNTLYVVYPVSWIVTTAVLLVLLAVAYKQFKKRVELMGLPIT